MLLPPKKLPRIFHQDPVPKLYFETSGQQKRIIYMMPLLNTSFLLLPLLHFAHWFLSRSILRWKMSLPLRKGNKLCNIGGGALQYAGNMIFAKHTWKMFSTYMENICPIYGKYLSNIWNTEWILYRYHAFYCQTKGILKSTILGGRALLQLV